jgi:hypothetical protein
VDGTIRLCNDLNVDPEDVVLLAVAYELKSPRVGEWGRKGWVDGWKALGCVACASLFSAIADGCPLCSCPTPSFFLLTGWIAPISTHPTTPTF